MAVRVRSLRALQREQQQRLTPIPPWQLLAELETPTYFIARDEWERHQPIAYHCPFRGVMHQAISEAEPTRVFYGSDVVRALTGEEVAIILEGRNPWPEVRKKECI